MKQEHRSSFPDREMTPPTFIASQTSSWTLCAKARMRIIRLKKRKRESALPTKVLTRRRNSLILKTLVIRKTWKSTITLSKRWRQKQLWRKTLTISLKMVKSLSLTNLQVVWCSEEDTAMACTRQSKPKKAFWFVLNQKHLRQLRFRTISECITSLPVWRVPRRQKRTNSVKSTTWM